MRIGIAGLGLIGGSLGLALRDRHDVMVFDTDSVVRERGRGAGLAVVDALAALARADAVLVATPLDAVVPTLASLAALATEAVLIDTGSLKAPVAAFADGAPPATRIVGGHPMAGSAASGFASADAELFRGRSFLLVPTARSDAFAMAVAGDIARAIGAIPTVCSAATHDRLVAATSAAPLAAAVALALLGDDAGGDALPPFTGPGFADATRLAATPAALAKALLADNPEAAAAIVRLADQLERIRSAAAGEGQPLDTLLERAREGRRRAVDGAPPEPPPGGAGDMRTRTAGGPPPQRANSSSIS